MMYCKLALQNVKKSFSDYMIYFLTLTFAVCIFYSFNAIGSQQAMNEINASSSSLSKLLETPLAIASVFVSIVLASLILYGNQFFIKKRKKELGIYMILGMSKNKISKIFMMEIFLIGSVSLIVGLFLGIIISQGISVLVVQLFEVNMTEYQFILSLTSLVKTILYFCIIFLFVALFNTFTIVKYQLIDLLYAHKKNESIKIKHPWHSIIIFGTSLLIIGIAYWLIKKVGLNPKMLEFWCSIVLGTLGTFLYFFSIMGFLMTIAKNHKTIYYKKLNSFVIKQINNKINTHAISMSLICLMLFLTIVGLTSAFSLKETMEKTFKTTTPFDASIQNYFEEGENNPQIIENTLKKIGFKFEGTERYVSYNMYKLHQLPKELMEIVATKNIKESDFFEIGQLPVYAVTLSDYNNMRNLNNYSSINLKQNELLVLSNNYKLLSSVKTLIQKRISLTIGNQSYAIKNKEIITDSLYTEGYATNFITLIVPDEIIENFISVGNVMNINYGLENPKKSEIKFTELASSYYSGDYISPLQKNLPFLRVKTKQNIYKMNMEMNGIVIFIGIYLGIVFLISSAAMLSIQQLAEASDSLERYEILRKIGTPNKMIRQTILVQTLFYYLLPTSLAIIHSVVGLLVVNDFMKLYGKPDIILSSILISMILFVIYGGYFYTTYRSYTNIVNHS